MYGLTWRYFFRRKKTFGIAVVMIVLSFLIPLLEVKDYHSFSQMGMIDEAYFLNQPDNLFAQLFVYLLPLLFGFLFGDIWINQRKMGDILTIRADRNKLFFSNWIITLILGVMVFYLFNALDSQSVLAMVGSSSYEIIHQMMAFLYLMSFFVAFIMGFLVIYASRFLIRRRKREFSIYLLLGMSKKKISRMLLCETLLIGLFSLGIGLLLLVLLVLELPIHTVEEVLHYAGYTI